MDRTAFSALRIELRPGESVLWSERLHRIEEVLGERVRIRDVSSGELRDVATEALRGIAVVPSAELDQRLEHQRTADRVVWLGARERESTIQQLLQGQGPLGPRVAQAASALQVSERTVRRWMRRYVASAQTSSLLPHRPGPKRQRRRLGSQREALIDEAIQRRYLVRPRTSKEEVYREVVRLCRAQNLHAPARNSVLARIRALDARLVARRRLGAKAAQAIALSTPGELEVRDPLSLVQIDHTLADVILVDSRRREPIGRPWLSLAIDVATRCVLGMHVTFDAPSALSVALCMEHACLPKERAAKPPRNADAPWPMYGLPHQLHLDNAAEFHSDALQRGCSEYGIRLNFRPPSRPHFGGHIERLIGTVMGRVHLLPGTTDSSPSRRGGYQAEREACMTLAEFFGWLSLEIAGQYHHTVHRILGTTPAAAWNEGLARGVIAALPADPRRFLISFLPVVRRRLQRNGIFFERIRYWADVLPVIAQPREPLIVRYDPRNLSRLFVLGRDLHYHDVPYANVTNPAISLAELREAYASLRASARGSIDEVRLFEQHARQRDIVAKAVVETKRSRRRKERLSSIAAPAVSEAESIDYSTDPVLPAAEIWETTP